MDKGVGKNRTSLVGQDGSIDKKIKKRMCQPTGCRTWKDLLLGTGYVSLGHQPTTKAMANGYLTPGLNLLSLFNVWSQ